MRYEIFHDVLAQPVLAWRTRHRTERDVEAQLAEAHRRRSRLQRLLALGVLALVAAATVFALVQRASRGPGARCPRSPPRRLRGRAPAERPRARPPARAESARLSPGAAAEDALRQSLVGSTCGTDEAVERALLAGQVAGGATCSGHGRRGRRQRPRDPRPRGAFAESPREVGMAGKSFFGRAYGRARIGRRSRNGDGHVRSLAMGGADGTAVGTQRSPAVRRTSCDNGVGASRTSSSGRAPNRSSRIHGGQRSSRALTDTRQRSCAVARRGRRRADGGRACYAAPSGAITSLAFGPEAGASSREARRLRRIWTERRGRPGARSVGIAAICSTSTSRRRGNGRDREHRRHGPDLDARDGQRAASLFGHADFVARSGLQPRRPSVVTCERRRHRALWAINCGAATRWPVTRRAPRRPLHRRSAVDDRLRGRTAAGRKPASLDPTRATSRGPETAAGARRPRRGRDRERRRRGTFASSTVDGSARGAGRAPYSGRDEASRSPPRRNALRERPSATAT